MIKVYQEYSLALEDAKTLFVKRSHEPSGRVPSFCLPKPLSGMLPRILYKAWLMNSFTCRNVEDSIRFRPPEAHRFVVWSLIEGDRVCFDFRKLVGFSKTVRIQTKFSLRLSSFAMNRHLFPVATGPGLLVMEAVGQPKIMLRVDAPESIPASRLIAWSIETVFELESEGSIVDDYMSPVYLKPCEGEAVVVDPDDPRRHTGGKLRQLLRLLFPYF